MTSLFTHPLVYPLIPGLPLLLAIGLVSGPLRRASLLFAPWAAIPALVASLMLMPGITLELPWLLLGTRLGLDEAGRVFLFFSALLWLVAGVYTTGYFSIRSSRAQFFSWFLLAMSGNLGLILAQDLAAFFTFFTLMSFASYGLVVHERTSEALRAGRIYIVLVVVGEVLLFAAFVLAALAAGSIDFEAVRPAVAGSGARDWIVGLTLLGFGIKAGVLGLHVWLPLAHPVAPTPASAVLSGAMIAAGLLGWLRVLPLGETALPEWGGVMITGGAVAAFYATLVGLMQSNPKTVLAYSSVSKMGIMTIGIGLGLVAPDSWPLLLSAILIYALHHGLAKGALFLGVGMAAAPPVSKGQRRMLMAGLLLPALALAGAPLTSGMIAKHLLKVQVTSVMSPWGDWLQILLPWSTVATSMLMGRFLYLVWPRHEAAAGAVSKPGTMWWPWIALLAAVVLSLWLIPFLELKAPWSMKVMISALWPAALGGGLAAIVWLAARGRRIHHLPRVPPGDILIIVENWLLPVLASGLTFALVVLVKGRSSLLAGWNWWRDHSGLAPVLDGGENRFGQWAIGTALFLMLGMVFVFLVAS